ncbi:MAG: hypothetical protein WA746_15095 [Isosphaeraceae bacterium]
MMIHAPRRALRLFENRQTLILLVALLTLMLTPGMRGRLFRARELTDGLPVGAPPSISAHLQAPRLVHLDPGSRLEGQSAPQGWSHLVIKSVPKLATGDLDTVSSQAFETARRLRPVIMADIRRSEPEFGSIYHLARVGVGICAPGQDGVSDRVISPASVEGTRGSWTAKQRIILAAMAYEVSRTHLVAATPTFALLRSPNTFLIEGSHRKVASCQALLVDSQSGKLRVIVWRDDAHHDAGEPSELPARLLSAPVFDCPQDVHASRVLSTPVAWSFAIRELPPGTDLTLPADLAGSLKAKVDGSAGSAALEQALIERVHDHE